MDKKTQLALEEIRTEVSKVVRRQDEIQKSVDLLFADRTILEEVQGSIQALKQIIVDNQEHQDRARDSVKADVRVVSDIAEDLKKGIKDNTVIVKINNKGFLEKVKKLFRKEEKKNGK